MSQHPLDLYSLNVSFNCCILPFCKWSLNDCSSFNLLANTSFSALSIFQSVSKHSFWIFFYFFKPSNFPVLPPKEMFVMLTESMSHSKMSHAYCPCHPCICAYRWSCIDLLINTIRNYYVDTSHTVVKLAVRIWELMRVSTYNCIQGLTLVLTVSAALIQQTVRTHCGMCDWAC